MRTPFTFCLLAGCALTTTAGAQQLVSPAAAIGVIGGLPMAPPTSAPALSSPANAAPVTVITSAASMPALPSVSMSATVGTAGQVVGGALGTLARALPGRPATPLPNSPTERRQPSQTDDSTADATEPTVTLRRTECRLVAVDPPNLDFDGVPALGSAAEHERIFNVSVYCPDDRAVRLVTRVSLSGARHPSHIPVKIRTPDASGNTQPAEVMFFRDGVPLGEQTLQTGGQELVVPIAARLIDPDNPDAIPSMVGVIEVASRHPGLYLVEEGTRSPRVTTLETSGLDAHSPWIAVADPAQ